MAANSSEMVKFSPKIKKENVHKTRIKHFRWVIASLVFFITLVNFIDRSAISFVIDPLKREFHFTDTQFGMILSAFGLGYVLLTAFGGWLVDRLGARLVCHLLP